MMTATMSELKLPFVLTYDCFSLVPRVRKSNKLVFIRELIDALQLDPSPHDHSKKWDINHSTTNRRNAMRRAEANAKWEGTGF
jgi:hypothetical protein